MRALNDFLNPAIHLYFEAFAFGIAMRFGLAVHPESKGIYIVEYLFVVLSVGPELQHHHSLFDAFSRAHS